MKNKWKQFKTFVNAHTPSWLKDIMSKIYAFGHKHIMWVVLAITPLPLIVITFIICLTLSVPSSWLIIVLAIVITEFPAFFVPFIVNFIKNKKATPAIAVDGCEKVETK